MVLKRFRLQQIPQIYHVVLFVGHLDSHRRLAGNGRLNTDIRRSQTQLDIVGQPHYLADLNALLRQKLIPGHGRTAAYICNRHPNTEVMESLLQFNGRGLILIPRKGTGILSPFLKQGSRREHIFLLYRLFLFLDFLGHRHIGIGLSGLLPLLLNLFLEKLCLSLYNLA